MQTGWVHDDNAAAFTDFYQLTMLQSYFRKGMEEDAVFDLFIRRLRNRNFFIACGLEDVLHYLENLHFSEDVLDYVTAQDQFDADFADYLADFAFTGDVYALPEGTPVFPDEPILTVVAPLPQAQLIETFLLNQISFQTNLATKARRVIDAAQGRAVVDFGMRRMHGTDAGMKAARAGYIAGTSATSNVLAGHSYDIPVTGTMAHSYIEAHEQEMDAFRDFTSLYPETTLLVDTYDTLAGVQKVIDLADELEDDFRVRAIRLDSGDLAELAHRARRMLDEAGLDEVQIFASSSLDEYAIAELLERGAPIDGFGVGTRLGTIADHPAPDTAYKISEYAGTGRIKLSSAKSNLPGRKQIFRVYENGTAARDVIAEVDEEIDGGTPLLELVMKGGRRTEAGRSQSLDDLRAQCKERLAYLPERLCKRDAAEPPYPVELSSTIETRFNDLRRSLKESV